jgi:hypothetical protein
MGALLEFQRRFMSTLLGPDSFEHVVHEFAREHPPRSAVLYDYGGDFPAFLATVPGIDSYPYFADVARFDWLIDQTGHCFIGPSRAPRMIPYYGRVSLPASLTCARFDYAVDSIRDSVELQGSAEAPAVNVAPNPRWLVLWRSAGGTSVKALSASAWGILNALTAGCDGMGSLERASERNGATEALRALRDEILTSSFVRLHLQEASP